MLYYLLDDDTRYIDDGHVAELCWLAAVTTDNMRSEGNYGDTGGYPRFSPDGWDTRMWPLMASTAFGRDPGHMWMLRWLGEGRQPPFSRTLAGLYSGVPVSKDGIGLDETHLEAPAGLLGICPVELPEAVVRWVTDHAPEIHRPDPGKTYFDKLSLRSGFGPRDEYFLLEGLGTCCHGHEDANALVRLTWNERAWIGEGDYIRAAPKFHNSVVVIRDGVGVLDDPGDGLLMPPLAALKCADDGPDLAMVQMEVARYNGVDWQRNVFWRKGRYVVFVDQLVCRQPGDYSCRCLWRLMGEPELGDRTTTLHQDGETFLIRTVGPVSQEIVPDPHEKGRWSSYPHSDGIPRVLHQTLNQTMEPGDAITFVNLMTPHPEIEIRQPGAGLMGIEDNGEETLLAVSGGRIGDLELEGPVGAMTLRGSSLTVRGEFRAAGNGPRTGDPDHRLAFRETMARAEEAAGPGDRPTSLGRSDALKALWDCKLTGPAVGGSALGDGLLVGCATGEVAWVDAASGAQTWSTRLNDESAPARVLAADLETGAGPVALVGTSDSVLCALDGASGAELWRQPLRNIGGRPSGTSALAVADLAGDGARSILAGTQGWYVNAFDADGAPLWANWVRYHAITALAVADADGDGHAEVMVGTEYSTPLTVHNSDGSFRWSTFEEVGSEGNATTPRRGIGLTHITLRDLDGDGVEEIVYGTADGWIYAVKPQDGAEVWHTALVGEVVGLVVHGDVVVAATEYGGVYGFSYGGELVWQRRDSSWLIGMVAAGNRLITAAKDGMLRAYDACGNARGSAPAGDQIQAVWTSGDHVVGSLAGGNRLKCFEVCD
jgi:outer membrane protein assembly factor BamB